MAKRQGPKPQVTKETPAQQGLSLGYGNKYRNKDGRTVVSNRKNVGITRERQTKLREYKLVSTIGLPKSEDELSQKRILTPLKVLEKSSKNHFANGRRLINLAGMTMKQLGIPYRNPDESRARWLGRKELSEVLSQYWVAGLSIPQMCEVMGINALRFQDAMMAHPAIWQKAREAKAQAQVEAIVEDSNQVQAGKMAADVANVLLRQRQFLAERLNAKAWAPKSKTEISGPDGKPVEVNAQVVSKVMMKLGVGASREEKVVAEQ